jgi:hypothetical protein
VADIHHECLWKEFATACKSSKSRLNPEMWKASPGCNMMSYELENRHEKLRKLKRNFDASLPSV